MAAREPATPSHPLHVLGRELHSRSGAGPPGSSARGCVFPAQGKAPTDAERARRGSKSSLDAPVDRRSADARPADASLALNGALLAGQRGRGALLAVVDTAEPELEQRFLPPHRASSILAGALQRHIFECDPWEGSEDLAKSDLADFLEDARTTASGGHDPLRQPRATSEASKAAAWECSTRLVGAGSGQAAPQLHAMRGESVGQSSTASGRSSDSHLWYSEASSALPVSVRPSIEAATCLPSDSASRTGSAQMRHLPPAIRRQLLDTVRHELSRAEAERPPASAGEEDEDASGACSTQ